MGEKRQRVQRAPKAPKNHVNLREVGKKMSLKGKGSSIVIMIVALVIAIAAFLLLLVVKDMFGADIVYKKVVVAKTDVPKNLLVTSDNVAEYFEWKQINSLDVTEGALEVPDSIFGQRSVVMLYRGEVVTAKDFENVSSNKQEFEDPVRVSLALGDIGSSVGGKLRAGDTINLTMMFSRAQLGSTSALEKKYSSSVPLSSVPTFDYDIETEEEPEPEPTEDPYLDSYSDFYVDDDYESAWEPEPTPTPAPEASPSPEKEEKPIENYVYDSYAKYVLENLYIEKVLDGNGVEISSTDTETITQFIIFTIDKKDELTLNNALLNATNIRVSQVLSKEDDESKNVTLSEYSEDGTKVEEPEVKPEETEEKRDPAAEIIKEIEMEEDQNNADQGN